MDYNDLRNSLLKDSDINKTYNSMDFQYQIIKELIKLRNSFHMTVEEFATFCCIDYSTLKDIEFGNLLPSITLIQDIVNIANKKIYFSILD